MLGHTYSKGPADQNDILAIDRVLAVSRQPGVGVAPNRDHVAGRGERQRLVPTLKEISEPRNRRL